MIDPDFILLIHGILISASAFYLKHVAHVQVVENMKSKWVAMGHVELRQQVWRSLVRWICSSVSQVEWALLVLVLVLRLLPEVVQ